MTTREDAFRGRNLVTRQVPSADPLQPGDVVVVDLDHGGREVARVSFREAVLVADARDFQRLLFDRIREGLGLPTGEKKR